MNVVKSLLIIIVYSIFSSCSGNQDWIDLNNNGLMDPYENTKEPIKDRVIDLISRMTLDEKISQMQNNSPTIDRLGLSNYVWSNEALHGVKASGDKKQTTVFPQSIGLASTWNPELVFEEATAISEEARALANILGNNRYLNFWDPMINIARDPRWGRTQEGYGEDPYLVSKISVAYIKGLQGNNDRYTKVIASPKHFVANNVDGDRHFTSSNMDQKILRDYYLPAFKQSIIEGGAQGLMSAYNALNGIPCSSNDMLLQKILRDEWGFDGHVVSDCGAIYNIHSNHLYVETPQEGVAISIKSGTDMNCGPQYQKYLLETIESGLLEEDELDISLGRILKSRFRLGMFDPEDMVPYRKISKDVINSRKHRMLTKKIALESMVLLKNEDNFLPLSKYIGSIAIIGPNANTAQFGNYSGIPSYEVTPLEGIKAKVSDKTIVKYAQGAPIHDNNLPHLTSKNLISPSGEKGLKSEFFNNMNFAGDPVLTRIDTKLVHHWWNEELFPDSIVNTDQFSVRWTGRILPKKSGCYMFSARTTVRSSKKDLGIRIYLDDQLIVNQWSSLRHWDTGISKKLKAGESYDFRVEYVEDIDWAEVTIGWKIINGSLLSDAVELAKNSDIVILVVGSSNATEEELHDRISMDLLPEQQKLVRKVFSVNPNTVMVLVNGSPVSINWENENIPAILEAWYPGQEGGNAISDIIFGDYNPNGKLPITFYKSVNQLPDFYDYDITKGRTYMYLKEKPLYPFGYGLSYTSFELSNFSVNKNIFNFKDTIVVSLMIKNTGKLDGSEVVQLYTHHHHSSKYTPLKKLRSFKKVLLNTNEEKHMKLYVPISSLVAYSLKKKKDYLAEGNYDILLGTSSENILFKTKINISY